MLPVGKLDSHLLKSEIFSQLTYRHPQVRVRPELGEDCAVLDGDGAYCILSTDPITGADAGLGKLAVHINCNDIATQGVRPTGLMLTVLAPPGTTAETLREIMKDAAMEAEKIGVEIIGGHTEITTAVNRIVISGVAIGFKQPSSIPKRAPQAGDWLLMTGSAGMEGTGILADACQEQLKTVLSEAESVEGKAFLDQISVVEEGLLGAAFGALKMHDVTEGGIYGAVWEMAQGAGTGCELAQEAIPVHPVTQKLCQELGVNPYRLISSGSMLMVFPPDEELLQQLKIDASQKGIEVSKIGKLTPGERVLQEKGKIKPLDPPEADELYRALPLNS